MRQFRFDQLRKTMVVAVAILVVAGFANAQEDDDDKKSATPPGLYITPKALANAIQQTLNPGLANYPIAAPLQHSAEARPTSWLATETMRPPMAHLGIRRDTSLTPY